MKEITISLNSIDKARTFIDLSVRFKSKVEVSQNNREYFDGKSIMNLFIMNLTKPLIYRFQDEADYYNNKEAIETFELVNV